MDNLLIGILLMTIGSFAGSSYYAPINKIKNWSWETYWICQGIVSWIILPWAFTLYAVPFSALGTVLTAAPAKSMFLAVLFGALWGIGGLTWGLSMRYLGISLGQSISAGFCAAFGTVIPPIVAGQNLFTTPGGWAMLVGVAISLAGIAVIGYAGSLRDKGLTEEEKKAAVKEFALKKGLIIAIFAGLMSACMAYGLAAGQPIADAAIANGCSALLSFSPVHIFVMFGGFLTNFVYCIYLFSKNKSLKEFRAVRRAPCWCATCSSRCWAGRCGTCSSCSWAWARLFISGNAILMAFSWSILMSLNIVFSNFWGIVLKEWKGSRGKTIVVLCCGCAAADLLGSSSRRCFNLT